MPPLLKSTKDSPLLFPPFLFSQEPLVLGSHQAQESLALFPLCERELCKTTRRECRVPSPRQVKPLIWIESVIEKHSHSRIEYMIKVRVRPARSVSRMCRA